MIPIIVNKTSKYQPHPYHVFLRQHFLWYCLYENHQLERVRWQQVAAGLAIVTLGSPCTEILEAFSSSSSVVRISFEGRVCMLYSLLFTLISKSRLVQSAPLQSTSTSITSRMHVSSSSPGQGCVRQSDVSRTRSVIYRMTRNRRVVTRILSRRLSTSLRRSR
ncbi:hypothetical protein K491DRAFT_92034 [Lophiostoma macrostomum CBS 122681]|uniref:Uncharacterized protein n=1 Tax=Lophiostoma macrostomum CBS 122681 TaxID=1314788 RepID=A0A6A6TJD7_9PLEO|nr:hypothetical protein K491DRAFT_92034 [Lophiostoma macrostomum CBS 122681]